MKTTKKTKTKKQDMELREHNLGVSALRKRRIDVLGDKELPKFKDSDSATQFAEQHLQHLAPDAALEVEHAMKFNPSAKLRTEIAFKVLGIGGVRERNENAIPPAPLVVNIVNSARVTSSHGTNDAANAASWMQRRAMIDHGDSAEHEGALPNALEAQTAHDKKQ